MRKLNIKGYKKIWRNVKAWKKSKDQLFFIKIANARNPSNNDRLPGITMHICRPAAFFMILHHTHMQQHLLTCVENSPPMFNTSFCFCKINISEL